MSLFKKIVVGMSGGVDSAVAALLLKQRGFEVHGVFMKNWDLIDETGCTAERDYQDALIVCDKLEIPLTQVDFVKQYWNDVFVNLVNGYQQGLTPNPDVLCNRYIKFKYFYNFCRNKLGCDAIATGHYANTSFGAFLENYIDDTAVRLLQPYDTMKDQTFFLSQVKQEPLRRTMFPLAYLKKSEVRQIARKEGLLNVATKRDSTGICFIGKRDFKDFMSEYVTTNSGDFVDLDTGQVVGKHDGIHLWTIGQRTKISGLSEAYYTSRKDSETNTIFVVKGETHSSLMTKYVITDSPIWINKEPHLLETGCLFECSFRYQNVLPLTECRVLRCHNKLLISIEETRRAIAPGQIAVLYKDGECLGSAMILYGGPTQYF